MACCKCTWDANVHFSRGPRSKLCTHCRSTAMGPGPASWVGPTELARCPERRQGGRPGAALGPEHGRIAPMAAPRCTRLAEVVIPDRETLFHAEKRNGSCQ